MFSSSSATKRQGDQNKQEEITNLPASIQSLTTLLDATLDGQIANRAKLSSIIEAVEGVLPQVDNMIDDLNQRNIQEAHALRRNIRCAKRLRQHHVLPHELDNVPEINLPFILSEEIEEAVDVSFANSHLGLLAEVDREEAIADELLQQVLATIEEQRAVLDAKKAILSKAKEANEILAKLPPEMQAKVAALKSIVNSTAIIGASLNCSFAHFQTKLNIYENIEKRIAEESALLEKNEQLFEENSVRLEETLQQSLRENDKAEAGRAILKNETFKHQLGK